LVVDLSQPGTATASLRDIWPETAHGELSTVLAALPSIAPGAALDARHIQRLLRDATLPVQLESQPSWSGGAILVLPWDELLADAAIGLRSDRVLAEILAALSDSIDLALIDYPSEGGRLLSQALAATDRMLMPLVPETPALEGAYASLRLLAQAREAGHAIDLAGVLLTRCDPKSRRTWDIVQALLQADDVEGEPLSRRLFPYAVRANDFFEQAFRYGEPVWERTSNPTFWAPYVLLSEWLLRDAGRADLAQPSRRRGPALLPPDTRILDVSSPVPDVPDVPYADFERAHAALQRIGG
jgi:hypothetical protein